MSVDIKQICTAALQAFPPHKGEVTDACHQHAHRLFTKALSAARKSGTWDESLTNPMRDELDVVLPKLAKRFRPITRNGPTRKAPKREAPPPPPDAVTLKREAAEIISGAFSAPFDGSEARADVLCARAKGVAEEYLKNRRVSQVQHWIMKRFIAKTIAKYRKDLMR